MTRFVLVAAAIGLATLAVAAGCSSSSDGAKATTPGVVDLSDADLTLGDGGRKASLDDSGACLASNNAAPTCSDTCNAQCTVAVTSFNPDVAANINACLATTSDCTTGAQQCVDNAAAAACDDDTAAAFCTMFLASCPDADPDAGDQTQSDCVSLIRSMSDTGRSDLQSCVTAQGSCATCIAGVQTLTATGGHH